jgi:hypothetical protein
MHYSKIKIKQAAKISNKDGKPILIVGE